MNYNSKMTKPKEGSMWCPHHFRMCYKALAFCRSQMKCRYTALYPQLEHQLEQSFISLNAEKAFVWIQVASSVEMVG